MLVIIGRVAIKPERREEGVKAALEMVAASQAEAGCISYDFYADLQDPNSFFAFEQWESEEALRIHFATDHMKTFQGKLAEVIAGRVEVKRYNVASITDLWG